MANIVAIVGRPNVGKSTLFNRLVEQRKAIMDNQSGITRDRHYGYSIWNGKNFTVIDTGGYIANTEELFEKAIRKQILIALEEASVVIWMVDCKDGITPMDQALSEVLRKTQKPTIIVVNKADSAKDTLHVHDFYQLGFTTLYPIAAINGSGTGDLLDEVVTHFSEEAVQVDNIPKIAILGRPNVGKSSLLNGLVDQTRSIVTPISGTTRDAIDTIYKKYGKHCILTDTAGIRKKAKIKENIEFYSTVRALKALQEADICMMIIDAEQGMASQDLHILELAIRYKKGIVLLVNKWDLISKDNYTTADYSKAILTKLAPWDFIPIIFISAINKQRIYQAMEKALEIYTTRRQKLSTASLNKVMLKVIERSPPPAIKGKYIKIKYVTQLPTHTPVFAFFCNLPQYIKVPYQRYLENQLRKNFFLEGVPIKLVFRAK